MDGIELTHLGAVAQADAGKSAGLGAAVQCSRSCTSLDALVLIAGLAVLRVALALHHSLFDHSGSVAAHDLGNGCRSSRAAGCALIAGDAVHDHSLCVIRTAGIAAAAAVCAGQAGVDFLDTGIFFHSHELGGCHQDNCAYSAHNGAEDRSGYNTHNPVSSLTASH